MGEWRQRRAQKSHQCTFCGEMIEPGDNYKSARMTPWDHAVNDRFFTWRAHPFCLEVWNEVAPDWDYEWAEDTSEFEWAAEVCFPERAAEYPWLSQGAEGAR